MIPFQREIADSFAAIRRDDPSGVIDQFLSLTGQPVPFRGG
jgi:hypothetical protein